MPSRGPTASPGRPAPWPRPPAAAAAAPPASCNANAHRPRSTPREPAQLAVARRRPWLCLPRHPGAAPALPPPPPQRPPAGHRRPPSLRWGRAARVGIRAAASSASTPWARLVPHGVKDATCNRARILAWWTRHPQANIGLATGHRFDVLDVDGPAGAHAIQDAGRRPMACTSSGPLVRTGGGGWHYYLAPTGLGNASPAAWSMWTGGAGAAMWSPHPAATPPATPTTGSPAATSTPRSAEVPAALLARLERRPPQRSPGPVELPAAGDRPARPLRPGGPGPGAGPGRHRPRRPAQPPAVGVDPQPLQPGRHRRPRPPRGRPGAPRRRRALRAARRGAPPDPPHPGLGPPGRPGPPRPPTPAHQPRTHPPLADPACSGGRRANQGEEVTAMAAAGQPAGQT